MYKRQVHDLGCLGAPILLGAVVGGVPVGHVQVDHVLPVVGSRLQHLARLDGSMQPEVRQGPPFGPGVGGELVQQGECDRPLLEQTAHRQSVVPQGRSEVDDLTVGRDQSGEVRPARGREGGEGERAREQSGCGFGFHGHVLLIAGGHNLGPPTLIREIDSLDNRNPRRL